MARGHREHYFMAAVLVVYLREGAPKQHVMNCILTTAQRQITMTELSNGRTSVQERMTQLFGIQADDFKDFVYQSIFYLGHMTEKEFAGGSQEATPQLVS